MEMIPGGDSPPSPGSFKTAALTKSSKYKEAQEVQARYDAELHSFPLSDTPVVQW